MFAETKKILDHYQPRSVLLGDGRILEVLCLPGNGYPEHIDWPSDHGFTVDLQAGTNQALRHGSFTAGQDLVDLVRRYPSTFYGPASTSNGSAYYVRGNVVGYSEAVPFQEPRSSSPGDEFLCIGGKVQQSAYAPESGSGAFEARTFTVPNARLQVPVGSVVGLLWTTEEPYRKATGCTWHVVTNAGVQNQSESAFFVPLYTRASDGRFVALDFTVRAPHRTLPLLQAPVVGTLLT